MSKWQYITLMKIGLIIYGNLEILSGGYLYDKKLVAYLQAHGHEVRVFTQPVTHYVGRLGHNFAWRFSQHILAYAPDVLLQDELNHPSLFLLNYYLKKRLQIPLITIVHHLYSTEFQSGWQKIIPQWLEQRYLHSVDGFIFNSHTTQQTVEALIRAVSQAMVALPGKDNVHFEIETEFIQRRCGQNRPLQIIFIGNIIPRKALDVLVDGLAHLPLAQWQLTVVGDTEIDPIYVQQIKQKLQRENMTEAVRFMGKVSAHELQKLMVNSDVLAVPSYYEGFGIVYVEALGAGLPVIAGKHGGGQEIIQPNENGYLVTPTGAEITESVAKFINRPADLERMSLAAYQSYAQFPTWDESMAKITVFLEALVEKKNSPYPKVAN